MYIYVCTIEREREKPYVWALSRSGQFDRKFWSVQCPYKLYRFRNKTSVSLETYEI